MSKAIQDLCYHLARHPGLPGIHQPHRFGEEGAESLLVEVAPGAVGEHIQDSGLRGTVGKQNHFSPGALLAEDPEQGDTISRGHMYIEEQDAGPELDGGNGLQAASRFTHHPDPLLGPQEAQTRSAACFLTVGDDNGDRRHGICVSPQRSSISVSDSIARPAGKVRQQTAAGWTLPGILFSPVSIL